MLLVLALLAADEPDPRSGKTNAVPPLAQLTAAVDAKRQAPSDGTPAEARVGEALSAKTTLSTGPGKARLEVTFGANSKLQLWSDSEMTLLSGAQAKRAKKDPGDVVLSKGTLVIKHSQALPLFVKTPHALVKVSGPRSKIRVDAERTVVMAQQGSAALVGGKSVGEGQALVAQQQAALPTQPELHAPGEGERVAVPLAGKVAFAWKRSTDTSLVEIATDAEMNQLIFVGEGSTEAGRLDLPPGNYYWQVSAVDAQRLESVPQGPRLFVVERKLEAPPAATMPARDRLTLIVPVSAAEEQDHDDPTFDVIGEVRPPEASVTVNGITAKTDTAGRFTVPVALSAGDNEILVEASDGTDREVTRIKVRWVPKSNPHRVGISLGPIFPLVFRNEGFGLELQLSYAYAINPYLALKAGVGAGATTARQIANEQSVMSPFYVLDAGVVTELIAQGYVIPYVEVNPLGLWLWSSRNFPDALGSDGLRTGRAQLAYAPNAGVGVRFRKDGNSIGVGLHYRVLVDQGRTSGRERSRVHGVAELRMTLSFN